MPRLSLYKPERGNDYEFLDRQILEMFTIGGTDIHIYKYIGTDDGTTVKDHTQIQDMMFLENRDRSYDSDIYRMRGIYNVQDNDFDLSQFGMFLSNDTLFMTIHIRSSVKTVGRKIMPGDVFELPHLKDEYAANDKSIALKRFYVVEDVNRASEGFSQTWWPHLYRVKLKQIYDGQEFKDILDLPADEDAAGDLTLRELLSTYDKEMVIANAVIGEAIVEAEKSGYDVSHYFTVNVDDTGLVELTSVKDTSGFSVMAPPEKAGYQGYIIGDRMSPNGDIFGFGISFPDSPDTNDYFLRTDFLPNRLFQFKNNKWNKVYDVKRADLYGSNDANNQRGTFINNTSTYNQIGGDLIQERQSLNKALRPKADN